MAWNTGFADLYSVAKEKKWKKKCFVWMQLTKYKFNSMTIIENKYSYLNIKKNYDRASSSNHVFLSNPTCIQCYVVLCLISNF
jgi:hypothetical protein